jgi:hypothetical protein
MPNTYMSWHTKKCKYTPQKYLKWFLIFMKCVECTKHYGLPYG